jgi:ubiquinone/menaquinone biosynthesis C-methylase UbiE
MLFPHLELNSEDIVLDAGCGVGYDTERTSKYVKESIGVDISQKMIDEARTLHKNSNAKFFVNDLRNLNFEDNYFTKCRIDRVLQHISNPKEVIKELIRVLNQNGKILVYDNDWSSFFINSNDRKIASIVEKSWANSFKNTLIGKEISNYFEQLELKNIKIEKQIYKIEDFDTANKVYNITQTIDIEVNKGTVLEKDSNLWINNLKASNSFFTKLTAYIVTATK